MPTIDHEPLITVGSGGIDPEKDVDDGTYAMVLVEIKDPVEITSKKTGEKMTLREWVFALDDDPTGTKTVSIGTSLASGPQSKQFEILTALLGRPPQKGDKLNAEDLIGRRVWGTVFHNDSGWPRIQSVMAAPRQPGITMPGAAILTPLPSAAPAQPTPTPAPTGPIGPGALTPDQVPTPTQARPEDDLGF